MLTSSLQSLNIYISIEQLRWFPMLFGQTTNETIFFNLCQENDVLN
jgi:hypothetical protein